MLYKNAHFMAYHKTGIFTALAMEIQPFSIEITLMEATVTHMQHHPNATWNK